MYPIDFVNAMIEAGRRSELCALLQEYSDMNLSATCGETSDARRFARAFLIAVQHSLNRSSHRDELDQDPVISVWASLGYFGINYDDTCEYSSIEDIQRNHK